MAEKPQTAAKTPQTITINDTQYDADKLSESARNQVANLRVTDQEIERVKQQLAIYQTARAAYANELAKELPEKPAGKKPADKKAAKAGQ